MMHGQKNIRLQCLSCYILSSGLQKLAEKMSYG